MALEKLANIFTGTRGKLAAAALSAVVTVGSFSGAAQADDASAQYASVTTHEQTATLSAESRARVLVDAAAFDYAYDHPGHVAVSVLAGPDLGGRPGSYITGLIKNGLEKRHFIESEGFDGDNGGRPTAITFHYLLPDTNGDKLVRSMGPYNLGDALAALPQLVSSVNATRMHYGLSMVTPAND